MTYGFGGGSTSANAGRYGGSSSNTASTAPGKSAGGTTSANSAGRYGGGGASSKSTSGGSTPSNAGRYGGGGASSLGGGSTASNAGRYGGGGGGASKSSTTSKSTGGGSTASNAGRYGGPSGNVASAGGARASTPAISAGSSGYGGPSTATGYSPDLSSRTRMGSVTFGGPKATTTGLDQNAIADRIASAFGTPTGTPTYNDANFNARTPTGTTPQQAAIASRINSAFGTMPQSGLTADIKGLGSPLGVGVSASDLSMSERRADLAQAARAAENQSMADYASEITGPASARTVGLAEQRRASEAQSMADLGSLKESYRVAIAGRETEGVAEPYSKVHPGVPQKNGTVAHALGKYGVMDFNVGPWTKEVLGVEMTAKDFLANPKAQDAVFDAKIGQYVAKTGSFEKAAQAWYGGPGSVGKPNNAPPKGVAGPTVGEYAQDALARQTNAYNDLKGTTQVAGTDTSSDVESRARAASVAARESVAAAAVAAGEDPQSREVQRRQDVAANEAYDAVKNGVAPTTAAQDEPAPAQPAPSQPTTQANVSLPQRAPKPTSRDAPAYKRGLTGTVIAGGVDVLAGLGGPVGLGVEALSVLFGGDTTGGLVADAIGGKFGENYASPERNTPMRGLGSGGDRFSDPTSAASNSASSTGQCPTGWHYDPENKRCVKDDTTAAATFEDKYLGGSSSFDDTGRPTPEQKWDWTSSKYIGVANAPSV